MIDRSLEKLEFNGFQCPECISNDTRIIDHSPPHDYDGHEMPEEYLCECNNCGVTFVLG